MESHIIISNNALQCSAVQYIVCSYKRSFQKYLSTCPKWHITFTVHWIVRIFFFYFFVVTVDMFDFGTGSEPDRSHSRGRGSILQWHASFFGKNRARLVQDVFR